MAESNLASGAELPVLVRKTDFPHWNRFAAVNDEFVPIHMDDDAGKTAGFPSAIGMGNLVWSYFHRMLRDLIGPEGRIEKISARYQQPNLRGSTISVQGRVAQVTDDGARVVVELWVEDENDRKLVSGQATVRIRPAG